jgi:hypothetical protein
MDTDE